MPPHHGVVANAIGFDDDHDLVTQVEEIQMSMTVIREHLLQQKVLQELHGFCLKCSSNSDECDDLKNSIQKLMDEGVVRVASKPSTCHATWISESSCKCS